MASVFVREKIIHPEQKPKELFLGNFRADTQIAKLQDEWKSARVGMIPWWPLGPLVPFQRREGAFSCGMDPFAVSHHQYMLRPVFVRESEARRKKIDLETFEPNYNKSPSR